MISNVKYEVSIFEILSLVKRKWKLICVLMVIFMLLCGGYAVLSSESSQQKEHQEQQINADYNADKEYYETFKKSQEIIPDSLKREWAVVYHDRAENPVFSINPSECEYEQIVIRFEGNSNHNWTVNNWISTADNQKLFGELESKFAKYKTVLISTARTDDERTTVFDETVVQVLSVTGFDAKKAADYLEKHFRKCATDENIVIEGISKAHIVGYNDNLWVYVDNNRGRIISLYNAFDTSSKLDRFITDPGDPQTGESNEIKDIIKYCLVGLVLGFIIGTALITISVFFKRKIISARQVADTFELELLSDCSVQSDVALEVLNANLDIMAGNQSNIIIVVDEVIKGLEDISSTWTDKSDRTFTLCTDIFDNPEMIEALKTTDGIIIGIKLGESRLETIQRVLLRANKLEQKVLGFVLL